VILGKNTSDTCALLSEVYGREAIRKSSVFEWHIPFKQGHENVEDDDRSGNPRFHRSDDNVKKMRSQVHSDRRLSIRAMAVKLNLDKEIER